LAERTSKFCNEIKKASPRSRRNVIEICRQLSSGYDPKRWNKMAGCVAQWIQSGLKCLRSECAGEGPLLPDISMENAAPKGARTLAETPF
jgi:hypothetical protein